MRSIKNAQVMLADYILLRKDFNFLASKTDNEIDKWILGTTAYVNENQVSTDKKVSSPIEVGAKTTDALRPVSYGRASVFRIHEEPNSEKGPRLIEAKGTGSFFPKTFDHANGLASFSEAIREYHYEKLVSALFFHSGKKYQTVPVYAVLHLGFNVKYGPVFAKAAGMVIRAAHLRNGEQSNEAGIPYVHKPAVYQMVSSVELLLRKYGVTSAIETADENKKKYDDPNIQLSTEGKILDFGTYRIEHQFSLPLGFLSLIDVAEEFKNGQTYNPSIFGRENWRKPIAYLETSAPEFVKNSDENLAVNKKDWGYLPLAIKRHAAFDKLTARGTFLGLKISLGNAGKKEALKEHCSLMLPVLAKLKMPPALLTSTVPCSESLKNTASEDTDLENEISQFSPPTDFTENDIKTNRSE